MDETVNGEGWRFFAGTILGLAAIMRFFDSIWAFRTHAALPDSLSGALFGDNLKTYGWIYLIVAIILLVCSVGVVRGNQFSRWVGMVGGGLLVFSAIWWMPFYPVWSLTYILLGSLVIYALTIYGGRESVEAAKAQHDANGDILPAARYI